MSTLDEINEDWQINGLSPTWAKLQRAKQEQAALIAERDALKEELKRIKALPPVAWSPRYSYFGYETQRAWCNGVPRPQDVDYYSRFAGGIDYAYAAPPDTAAMLAEKDALLRQALEALEPFELSTSLAERTAEAIRKHHTQGAGGCAA